MKNQLNFRHNDSTIAFVEPIMPPNLNEMKQSQKDKINFELQNLKYI